MPLLATIVVGFAMFIGQSVVRSRVLGPFGVTRPSWRFEISDLGGLFVLLGATLSIVSGCLDREETDPFAVAITATMAATIALWLDAVRLANQWNSKGGARLTLILIVRPAIVVLGMFAGAVGITALLSLEAVIRVMFLWTAQALLEAMIHLAVPCFLTVPVVFGTRGLRNWVRRQALGGWTDIDAVSTPVPDEDGCRPQEFSCDRGIVP